MKILPSRIVKSSGKIFLNKSCDSCNEKFSVLLENDANFFYKVYGYYFNDKYPIYLAKIPLEEIFKVKNFFTAISIITTSKCNLNCPICLSQKNHEDISLETIKKSLNFKNKWITLTGGEPTVREDLPEIIKLIRNSGNLPLLQTNGLRFADIEYARELRNAGLKYLHLSFNGFNKDVYKKIYGDEKLLDKKIEAIKNMEKIGFRILLSMAVDYGMEKEILDCIKFAVKNNKFIKGIFIRPIECEPRVKYKTNNILTMSDIAKLMEKLTEGKIKVDDFLEYRRFRWNLYQLFEKLFGDKIARKIYPEVPLEVMLQITNGKYKLFIEKNKLVEMNKLIENTLKRKNKISYIKLLRKILFMVPSLGKDQISLLSSVLLNKFELANVAEKVFDNGNILRIWIDKVYTPTNVDLRVNIKTYSLAADGGVPIVFTVSYLC